jgi:hypothetical protein
LDQKPRSVRLQRIVLVLTVIVIFAFMAKLAWALVDEANSSLSDFICFFEASRRIRTGQPLYHPGITLGSCRFGGTEYLYPPTLALVLLPAPSYQVAWWGWAILSLACWLGALALIVRELAGDLRQRLEPIWWPVLTMALVNFPPALFHLTCGQMQLLILMLATLAWLCLRRGRDGTAGVLLGLTIALKLYPALILLPLFIQRRWRCVVAAGSVAGSILFLGYTRVGWNEAYVYVTTILPGVSAVGSQALGFPTIGSLLREIAGDCMLVSSIEWAIRVVIAGAVAWWAFRQNDAPDRALTLGMTTLVLVPPLVWEHFFVLLYLPWLEMLARSPRRRLPLLAVIYFLIATASLAVNLPEQIGFLGNILPISGALLLLGCQLQANGDNASSPSRPGPTVEYERMKEAGG